MAGQSNEQQIFGKAFIAQGSGDLVLVTDFSWNLENGAKQVHTLRQSGAGVAFGPEEGGCSFNFPVGENGFERDYVGDIQNRRLKQLRIKSPGGAVFTYNGAYKNLKLDASLDDATKGSVEFVGKLETQRRSTAGVIL
jgi:hypothetical protein